MTAIRSIVVATDLSARSDRAVDRAILLGREWHVRVVIVHALEGDRQASEDDVRSVLPNLASMVNVDIAQPVGPAPHAIVETAEATGSGLIVTGVARYNHVSDFFLGTAVDHVVRHAARPVLVVKQRAHAPYRRLMIATDFSDGSKRALLRAAEMFPAATLHILHGYHIPFEARLKSPELDATAKADAQRSMDALLAAPDLPEPVRLRLTPHLVAGSAESAIAQVSATVRPDLVVIGAHGISAVVQAAIGSTASDLLRSTRADTLVVPRR